MDLKNILWIIVQIAVGYNLVFPFFLFLIWRIKGIYKLKSSWSAIEEDYAIIVTAYQYTLTLNAAVQSILKLNYSNYHVYVVADNCDVSGLQFNDPKVTLLKPPYVLASNTGSHRFAIQHFVRPHKYITIIDSDNTLHSDYLTNISLYLNEGFLAVQGKRDAKNLNNVLSRLDGVRDMYYHFFDGRILFDLGSSATLAGSGMAFSTGLYRRFLDECDVRGAGFDKVLQNFLVSGGHTIAFSEEAIVYDEKTSRSDQLVKQRSRWINTWFKYFKYGFSLFSKGIRHLNVNQSLFGIILLRPPLFMFLILSVICLLVNIYVSWYAVLVWLFALVLFFSGFVIALFYMKANRNLYIALLNSPIFIFLQVISLIKSRRANQNSVSTEHYYTEEINKP